MSKKAIKKLNEAHPSYDLTVATTTVNTKDATGKATPVPAVQAKITIFEHGEKGAVIKKKSEAYGIGENFNECQDAAIEKAVELLGL
jgi:hypothetical protein